MNRYVTHVTLCYIVVTTNMLAKNLHTQKPFFILAQDTFILQILFLSEINVQKKWIWKQYKKYFKRNQIQRQNKNKKSQT